ncbi:MAG: hypothetical protein Q7V58_06860 [Actinomycetota bacterium]|nr:hypothetical protein [Actinomycetota bacterium]
MEPGAGDPDGESKAVVTGDDGTAAPLYRRALQANTGDITRQRVFPAWVGRPDHLLRIEKLVEDALERAYNAELARVARPERATAMHAERFLSYMLMNNEVTGQGGRVRRRGPIASILAEMDTREIESVRLGNADEWDRGGTALSVDGLFEVQSVLVRFGRGESVVLDPRGTVVRVSGTDPLWVGGTFDALVTEVSRGVPRWAFVFHSWFALLVSIMFGTLLAAAVYAYSLQMPDVAMDGGVPTAAWAVTIGLLAAVVGMVFGRFTALNQVGRFEIVEAGSSSRIARLVGAGATIAGLVLAIAGIALAFILRG